MRASSELERFIRGTLGCGCPDEVFEHVVVNRASLLPEAPGEAWWIEVGGRLLIAVVDGVTATDLPAICAAALARRDTNGFNRFRLVVADAAPDPCLDTAFAPLAAAHDRLHLHRVAPAELPPLASTSATESQ